MKSIFNYFFYASSLLFAVTTAQAQFTEDFETLADGTDSFVLDGKTFTSSNTDFDVTTFVNAGAGGSDKFMDNLGIATTGASYSITTGGDAFTMQSLDMYVSAIATGDNPTPGQSVEFVGKLAGATVWTYTKTTGFPSDFSVNEGFFELDFATEPGADYSIINIDELQITLQGTLQYVALDDFIIDSEILNTDPPFVQSIAVVGTPTSTATSVDFLVTFNEEAVNVTLDDFTLDAVGTLGNLASISGSVNTYTITVDNISGEGTISVDLSGGNDIEDTLGNSPAPAFTAGEDHVVTRCFQETFEGFVTGDIVFSSNGIGFETTGDVFDIGFFAGGGSSGSDQFLDNDTDLGVNKNYSISTSGGEAFNIEAMDFYASSDGGTNPTDDGTLTLTGVLGGSTVFTITKTTGFPTDFSTNGGWFTVDFATDGAADYSLSNIDEIRIATSGAFNYIATDNFEHCEGVSATDPPIVLAASLVGDPEANASSVDYTVVFNEDAVNVSADDFGLTFTGTATGSIDSVSGSANTYTVSITGISGEGSLRLDLLPGTDIADLDGNTPPDPFTDAEVHLVSSCYVETFEALALDANVWTRAGVPFSTSTTLFSVDEFIGAGAGSSDRYLDNIDDQGIDKTYSISVTNTSLIYMESFEVFVSSEANGANPTNDGSLTVRGLLDGVEVYSFTKTGSFPTTFGSTNGFSTVDFATDGAADYSGEDVDQVEVTISGSFIYVAVDNFKFCEDIVAPIAVCQDVTAELGADGTVLVAPVDADGGSSDNAARFYLGFETSGFDSETTAGSTSVVYGGNPFLINEFAFTVPVTGDYTPVATGTSSSDGNVITFFDAKPDLGIDLFTSPNYLGFVNYNNSGVLTASDTGPVRSFEAGKTYFMHVLIPDPGAFGMSTITWDLPIIADAPLEYSCSDIGTVGETLYAFDDAGNIDSCATDITINGRVTDWDGAAWDNGTPDLGAVVAFSGDYNTVTGSIESCSCLIGAATVTVAAGDYLLATDEIVVGATGNLVVEHEGSVVQTLETATTLNTGSISVQKTTPSLSLRDFSIIGSPMSMQAATGLYDPARVRMFGHNTLNFVPNTDVATAFPSAENFADDNGDNWSPYTGTLNVGEGYMYRRRGVDAGPSGVFTIDFNTGTLNSGPVATTAVFNTDQNSSPNLVSNPYASAIDADLFIAENAAIVSTLYFWEHLTAPSGTYPGYAPLNYDMGDISMYTSGSGGVAAANGGVAPTEFIASAQGFAYKAAAAGTVNFNNAMRVTGPNNTFRALEPTTRDRIWLNLTNETYSLRSQALIAFVDGATAAMEPHFDAKRLATPVSIYSQLSTGEELAINGLPVWEAEAEVFLGMSSMIEADAVFTISIAEMEFDSMPLDIPVYLIDHVLNTQTDLTQGDYTFRALDGTYDNRFSLVFEQRVLSVDDNQLVAVGLHPNPASDMVTLSAPNGTIIQAVTVYDIRGRQVMQHQLSADQTSFSVAELDAAVYILKVTTDNGTQSLRLIKE